MNLVQPFHRQPTQPGSTRLAIAIEVLHLETADYTDYVPERQSRPFLFEPWREKTIFYAMTGNPVGSICERKFEFEGKRSNTAHHT